METSQGDVLSEDDESQGFDIQAGQSWIYPTNYPLRDYQFNIVQKALLQNTLVSLPTGLGKTFIAAVVMYNFFRWFPRGKIIFMAPTRPLVKQQIDACYNIMAIPREMTTELTGSKVSSVRPEIWHEKRVFFATPQVLQNDLNKILELGSKIKCLVFDEAHKARGNHAYCEVIRRLKAQNNQYFRVLALSATPGSTIHDVLEIVQNLLISHLEFRTEESLDVKPYVFNRSLETVVVPLGDKLLEVKNEYIKILEYFTRTLLKYKVITGNCGNLTKGRIFMTMKDFQQKQRGNSSSNYSEIMKSLNICVTLYHAYELLERHGLRSFLSFFDEHIDKPLLRGNGQLIRIMEDVRNYLGPAPNVDILPDGTVPEIPRSIKFGHPKYYKLQEVLTSHFQQSNNQTRVIVFFEYRESVMEAYALLLQARPLIKPKIFLGQGSGITQRVQVKVVKDFREGLCNVLLSTCIGEEGLDVGEVDLIVCFDISNKSPVRMVQRMGRTGRKREGRVVVLVTEGKEQQTLKDCLIHKNNIAHYVLSSSELLRGMYPSSPRLVPEGIQPRCEKIHITVKPVLMKKSTLKDIFRSISSTSSEPNFSPDLEIEETIDRLPKLEMLCCKSNPIVPQLNYPRFSYSIDKQRSLQPTCIVRNSKSSELLVDLLQIADSRRFNIPMSQMKGGSNKPKNLKQSDIRNMFMKTTTSQNDFQLSQKNEDKINSPNLTPVSQPSSIGSSEYVQKYPKEVFTEISTYLMLNATLDVTCKYCPTGIDCKKLCHSAKCDHTQHNFKWIPLDDRVFEKITLETLEEFEESLNSQVDSSEFEAQDSFANIPFTQLENQAKEAKNETIIQEKSFSYEPPKNLSAILNKCSVIDDAPIYDECKISSVKEVSLEELLCFFKVPCLDEFFSDIEAHSSQGTIICSPDIIDESPVFCSPDSAVNQAIKSTSPSTPPAPVLVERKEEFSSPILSASERLKKYKRKIYFEKTKSSENDSFHYSTPLLNGIENKSVLKSQQLFGTPRNRKENCEASSEDKEKMVIDQEINDYSDVSDICDVSILSGIKSTEPEKEASNHNEKIELSDICDCSALGIEQDSNNKNTILKESKGEIESNRGSMPPKKQKLSYNSKQLDSSDLKEVNDICDLFEFGISSQKENEKNSNVNDNTLVLETDKTNIEVSMTEYFSKGDIQTEKKSQVLNKTVSQMSITQMLDYIGKSNTQAINIQNCRNEKTELDNKKKFAPVIDLTKGSPEKSKTGESHEHLMASKTKPDRPSKCSPQNSKIIDASENDEEFSFSFNSPKKFKLSTNKNTNADVTPVKRKAKKIFTEDINSHKIVPRSTPSTTPKSCVSALNSSEATSDDEFEDKPKSPVWIKPKAKDSNGKNAHGSFNHSSHNKPSTSKKIPPRRTLKSKNKLNPFIEEEAELSEDDNVFVSDDEENHIGENLDRYDESFVHDETQYVGTQMQAKYLQSIRSPSVRGKFKIPAAPRLNPSNIYSQPIHNDEENTYLDDSFCVDEDYEETQIHDLSELEVLELKLKARKKRKKSEEESKPKRRRILVLSDDSD